MAVHLHRSHRRTEQRGICRNMHIGKSQFDIFLGRAPASLFGGRLCRCFLRTRSFGTIALYSIYLKDKVGLHSYNRSILSALGEDIAVHGCPVIVG
eukprot:5006370-Pyramimonas_sp.AAC.1